MRALLMLALALALAGCRQEKVHKGKTTSAWVQEVKEGRWGPERWRAAMALGEIGPEAREALPALIGALDDKDHVVRWATAGALSRFGTDAEPAIARLQELEQKDPNRAVREAAGATLRALGREPTGRDGGRAKEEKQPPGDLP